MKEKNISKFAPQLSAMCIALGSAFGTSAWAQEAPQLSPVIVIGERLPSFGTTLSGENLSTRRFATNDTASLLEGTPGVSIYTGGGVSSLPVINGLADDRLKIVVDGMSITSACPNHMNPALSYVDPTALGELRVYAGIVPVSQGGDSIGGAIIVKSAPPVFAQGEGFKASGNVTAFHRGNGNVGSMSMKADAATQSFSIGYVGNAVQAENYQDGQGRDVVASHYKVRNNTLNLAALAGSDLWTLTLVWQDIPYQGYPNQSMDMTYNKSASVNAGYTGVFTWGTLEARVYRQHVRHKMDVLQDKAAVAGLAPADSYMPMDTDAVDLGYSFTAAMPLNEKQSLRLGHEFHRYTLDDWWPPLMGSMAMEPNTFWNVNGGQRERLALFAELDTVLRNQWSTQMGARMEHVSMKTGNVQGYYDASSPFGDAYQSDAVAFNAKDHVRNDLNWDLTASARYLPSREATFDIGLSRKTRSPNLHERYTWSSEAMMAGLMNNWFGDLNSYVGNLDLKPEVAYSIKVSADWHDAELANWQVKVAPFYTYVNDYINAVANTSPNPYNMSMLMGRQSLTFANQDAQLYGVDISARKYLGKAYGDWAIRGTLSYTRGKTTSGENLYNIMPLNARVTIDHSLGAWSNALEAVMVAAKADVSAVRVERPTADYAVVNFRTTYKLNKSVRLDAGIDNLFNRQYDLPLGGLEYVSAGMMNEARPVRAMGQSVNLGLSVSF